MSVDPAEPAGTAGRPLVVGGWEPGAVAVPWLPGEPWWAVWGIDDKSGAHRLVDEVWRTGVPGRWAGQPWALVLRRPDGTVLATASTGLRSGLFWSVDRGGAAPTLVIGPHPGEVVRRRRQATHLDGRYLTAFAQLRMPSAGTPYREVRRIRPGLTLAWSSDAARPRATEWNGPSTWAAPTLQGPGVADRFVEVFDLATAALMEEGKAPHVAMSGGLDSTFLAASLALQTDPDRPVTAYCYAPHAKARLRPVGALDPDESELARAMARRYPGRLHVVPLVNEGRVLALDVADRTGSRSWLPVLNPSNQVWMETLAAAAGSAGSSRWFVGDLGNGVFSNDHAYAIAYHLRRREGRTLWRLVRDDPAPWPAAALTQLVRPLLSPLRHRWRSRGDERRPGTRTAAGVPVPPAPPALPPRWDLEPWYTQDLGFLATLHPGADPAFPVDPFGDREVVALAASIAPAQWRRGPAWRAFARTMMRDRVPDEIRLRTRRGGQSWDAWYVAHDRRDRYEAEVDLVTATPVLGGLVDVDVLRATVRSWHWGEPVGGAPLVDLFEVDRLLSLAAFARTTDARLRSLNRTGGQPAAAASDPSEPDPRGSSGG